MDFCNFSGEQLPEGGSGIVVIKDNGSKLFFKSSKCYKNYLLGRDPRNFKWTKKFVKGMKFRSRKKK